MKKTLLILVAVIGFGFSANAQDVNKHNVNVYTTDYGRTVVVEVRVLVTNVPQVDTNRSIYISVCPGYGLNNYLTSGCDGRSWEWGKGWKSAELQLFKFYGKGEDYENIKKYKEYFTITK